eukprot:jgi/Ulvmu1/8912/UM005_0003.1
MQEFDVDALLDQQLEEKRRTAETNASKSSRHHDIENERPRERDRHRDRDSDRRERSSRETRDRDRDRDHRGSRERTARRDGRDDRRSRDNDRDRDRDRHRSSGGDLRRSRDREREPPKAAKPRTPTPERELREMQRMACTVMAYGLSVMAGEYDVFDFFSQAGEVVDVRMIMDKHTMRHKGISYIEYKDRSDFLNALQLNGKPLKGMPVNVKAAEAEKNFAWEAQELQKRQNRSAAGGLGGGGVEAGGPTYIKVENIPNAGLTEEDVKPVFEAFGTVQSFKFERDSTGRFTGIVFVQYPTAPEARKAQLGLDGSTALGGPPLRLSTVETPSFPGASAYPGELDEGDEAGGMRLNASARTALMGRMSGAAGIERPKEVAAPLPPPPQPAAPVVHVDAALEVDKGVVGSASPRPTQCLLLKNMFSPEEEEGEDWPEEIAQDTQSECEKYGRVEHVYVDRNSRGFVYLKFADEAAAAAAQSALHGRWYSHKQIIADFQFTALYNRHFNI